MASQLSSSFTKLAEFYKLLSSVAQKTFELQSTNSSRADVSSLYAKCLSDFKDDVTGIYIRSSLVSKLGQDEAQSIAEKANESALIAQIDGALASATEALEGEESVLSIARIEGRGGERQDVSSESLLQAETHKLTQQRLNVKARFESLFSLCEDQLLACLAKNIDEPSLRANDVGDFTALLSLAFYKSPFRAFTEESSFQKFAQILASLNSRDNNDINYSTIMINAAKVWIDDYTQVSLSSTSQFSSLCERYLQLLVGFVSFLDTEIAALPPQNELIELNTLRPTAGNSSWIPDKVSRLLRGGPSELSSATLEATEARETRQQFDILQSIYSLVKKEIDRERSRKFSVALCGMVKSGKSLFLSAVLGHSVLPSDELPSTAWPCRIRHVKGQAEPHLILCEDSRRQIFQDGILALRSKLKNIAEGKGRTDIRLNTDEHRWEHNVAPTTKKNWDIFKRPSFVLPNEATGAESVYQLMAQMNDVVRLCRSFEVKLDPERGSWPLIFVEFESLRNEPLDGTFEFYDLPGVGEFTEYFLGFQELIGLVAREANAIVPIVSLKEVSKNDWRSELPQIILTATGMQEPPLIICTHRDQVEERYLQTQCDRVLAAFCSPENNASDKKALATCVSCSSRLGLGAQTLIKMSRQGKPDYESVTNESLPEAIRDCVKQIVGNSRRSKTTFNQFSDEDWMEELREKLEDSALTEAMGHFAKTMARDAHSDALRRGVSSISRLISKFCSIQAETLLRMRRTKGECEAARESFREAERVIKDAQQSWRIEEDKLRNDALDRIRREFDSLENDCASSAAQLFREAEQDFVAKYQNVKARHELFEDQGDRLRFLNEQLSLELLGDVLQVSRAFLSKRRGIFVTNARRTIVDEEIKKQLDYLTTLITVRLGKEQRTLVRRLDHEANDIEDAIREVTLSTFAEKASSKEVDKQWIDECFGGREKSTSYMVISRSNVTKLLQNEMIHPYIRDFRGSAESAFKRMMELGRDVAEKAVTTQLGEEKARYDLELSKKGTEPPQDAVAARISSHMNFVAAEAALQKLELLLANHCIRR